MVALYEQGQVWHKAGMGKAEDEMMDFDPVTQKSNGKSPNRVDSLTQLLSELSGVSDNFADLLQLAIGKG